MQLAVCQLTIEAYCSTKTAMFDDLGTSEQVFIVHTSSGIQRCVATKHPTEFIVVPSTALREIRRKACRTITFGHRGDAQST